MEKLTHILKEEQSTGGSPHPLFDRITHRVDTFLDSNSLAVLISLALITLYCWSWGMP